MAASKPQKRKATNAPDTGVTESKRARYSASTTPSSSSPSGSPSPSHSTPHTSLPLDAQSIASTSLTSASTSRQRPKKYLCAYEDCGKAFDRPIRLQIHVRSHTNDRPYACGEEGCDKTFLRAEHLTRHVKDKHCEVKTYICTYNISPSSTLDDDGGEGGTPAVQECGKSFTTATRLRRHIAVHEAREETRCQEPGCGRVFRKQETLQRHIKQDHLHEKAFRCSHVDAEGHECEQAFAKAEQLKAHTAREHAGVRYFCDMCPPPPTEPDDDEAHRVGFATYTLLQTHIHDAHPPTCTLCGHQTASNRALKAHLDIAHSALATRQQAFPCTWVGCGRGFTKSGNLKVHVQNVHTKARNFVCGEFDLLGEDRNASGKVRGWNGHGCGSAFGTKGNLEEHVRTQHLGLPGKEKKMRNVKSEESTSTLSMLDAVPDDPKALSMLTGAGYADTRRFACLVPECRVRFARDCDRAVHLELTHGWQVEDVEERLAVELDQEAMGGDQPFWIGGLEEDGDEGEERHEGEVEEEDGEDGEDEEERLRRELVGALAVHNGYGQELERHQRHDGITVNGMLGADGGAMVIDPALIGV